MLFAVPVPALVADVHLVAGLLLVAGVLVAGLQNAEVPGASLLSVGVPGAGALVPDLAPATKFEYD